jgi:hypothetical protein
MFVAVRDFIGNASIEFGLRSMDAIVETFEGARSARASNVAEFLGIVLLCGGAHLTQERTAA